MQGLSISIVQVQLQAKIAGRMREMCLLLSKIPVASIQSEHRIVARQRRLWSNTMAVGYMVRVTFSGAKEAYISIEIDIFGITTGSNSCIGCNTAIYAVNRPKRINVDLQTGQCFLRTRLECGRVTGRCRIKSVDGS